MDNDKLKIVGFRCEIELDQRLQAVAAQREQDKSKLIRWILKEHLPQLERESGVRLES